MLPIRDTIRSRMFPVINWMLVLVNVLVFLFELSLGQGQLNRFLLNFALVPARLDLTNPLTWYPLLTHMFLHGGWLHLISNMWILIIFGDNVEDRLGSARYLVFYLSGGIAAGLIQSLNILSGDPNTPSLGASGAIAAVLGAYILFYPRARVTTLFLIIIIPIFLDIPAVIFLGIWFVTQLYSGLLSLSSVGAQAGIAWWAHIGGFLFGLILGRVFAAGRRPYRWHPDEYYPW